MTGQQWWRGAAIYQIYPRSFADSNGDGIGDLAGIAARLDHIASLGVDAIWLSPFFASPMKDFGYDVSDYCDVDPIFGTLADFDRVVARAHELGLRVIIDQVFSHTSDQHSWFKESRSSRDNPRAAEALALAAVRTLAERFELLDKRLSDTLASHSDDHPKVTEWSGFRARIWL